MDLNPAFKFTINTYLLFRRKKAAVKIAAFLYLAGEDKGI